MNRVNWVMAAITASVVLLALSYTLRAHNVPDEKPGAYSKVVKDENEREAGKKLVARSITLVDEDGKPGITISASKAINGIWVNTPGGKSMVALYGSREQGACLGLYGDIQKDQYMPFAVTVNSSGKNGPYFQLQGESGPGFLDGKDLLKLKPAEPKPQD